MKGNVRRALYLSLALDLFARYHPVSLSLSLSLSRSLANLFLAPLNCSAQVTLKRSFLFLYFFFIRLIAGEDKT